MCHRSFCQRRVARVQKLVRYERTLRHFPLNEFSKATPFVEDVKLLNLQFFR